MCGGIHYGEVEGLVSVARLSCSRGASCVVEYTTVRPRVGLNGEVILYTMGKLRVWSL